MNIPQLTRVLRAFDYPSIWLPSLRGILKGRAEPAVLRARISFWLTGTFQPFTTRDGCQIETPMSLLSWWDYHVMAWLFDKVTWPQNVARVLDIGANEGIFGWEVKRRYPQARLTGYEPNYNAWIKAVDRKHYDRLYCKAVGFCDGEALLFSAGLTHSTDTLYSDGKDSFPIEVIRLDSIYSDGPAFDVVKIDVDGAELDVVLGGLETLRKAKLLLIEISRPREVESISTALGRKAVHLGNLDYAFYK